MAHASWSRTRPSGQSEKLAKAYTLMEPPATHGCIAQCATQWVALPGRAILQRRAENCNRIASCALTGLPCSGHSRIPACGRDQVPCSSISWPHCRPPACTSYDCYGAGRSRSRMTLASLLRSFDFKPERQRMAVIVNSIPGEADPAGAQSSGTSSAPRRRERRGGVNRPEVTRRRLWQSAD
jgi:hypothetical protein